MDELGLEVPDEYIRTADYLETKEAARQTRELLNLADVPTCIIYRMTPPRSAEGMSSLRWDFGFREISPWQVTMERASHSCYIPNLPQSVRTQS